MSFAHQFLERQDVKVGLFITIAGGISLIIIVAISKVARKWILHIWTPIRGKKPETAPLVVQWETLCDGRKKLLADAREFIQSDSFIENHFVTHDLFIRLKPYLSEECIKQFETSAGGVQTFVMSTGGGYSVPTHTLLGELARIEREWKLV